MALVPYHQLMANPPEALEILVNSSTEHYTWEQFREVCGVSDSSNPLGYLWDHLYNNRRIEMDTQLLHLCGFSGLERRMKEHFIRFLVGHQIVYEAININQAAPTIYVTPDHFYEAVMKIPDESSDRIRDFMVMYTLMKLKYGMYEKLFERRLTVAIREERDVARAELQQALELNAHTMESLQTVTDELQEVTKHATKQPDERRFQSVTTLFLIEQVHDDGRDHASSQNGNAKLTLYYTKRQRGQMPPVLGKLRRRYPGAEVSEFHVFDLEANGSHLFLRVKKHLKRFRIGVRVDRSTIRLGESVTPDEFLGIVRQVRGEREAAANRALLALQHRYAQQRRLLTRRR